MKRCWSPFVTVAVLAFCAWTTSAARSAAQQGDPPPSAAAHNGTPELSVRITSPLGRTGTAGTIRIVAQVRSVAPETLEPVRFYVDGVLVGTATAGPPFAVPWVDDNPFERREILVQASDAEGRAAEDKVVLDPYVVTEATQVNSILVQASIYDKKGRYVRGLDASKFSLTENNVPQKIDLVGEESIPATFALLVDGSQSMSRRMPFVREAASRVVSYLNANDNVLVVPFGTELRAITGPTNDRETVSDAIGSIDATGRTSIHDSLVAAADLMKKIPSSKTRVPVADGNGETTKEVPDRKVLILITDGYDETSRTKPQQAIDALKESGTTVYTIGIGGVSGISLKGQTFMKDLAAATGGGAFFPRTEESLGEVYDAIAADAQNKYLVTYTPLNQTADGKWRTINLKVEGYDKVVADHDGYQAPEPAPIKPSIDFAVTDLNQHYVDITRDDLIVLEDGVEQKIETFQEAISPVSIVLALDESGSMKKSAEQVKAAARAFVEAMRPEDKLAIIVFGDKATVAQAFTTERDWSMEAIDAYEPAGGTALYDALWDALLELKYAMKEKDSRGATVVLTDGRDEDYAGKKAGSVHTYDEVVNLMRETEAAVFPVGLGTNIDSARLRQLAQMSGGNAYFPLDVTTIEGEYAKVIENLRRRFVLSYTSTHADHDGSWRTVEIKSRRKDVVIYAKSGYNAPDK
jgi:Ca-activated chloride channel family protein